MGVSEKKAAAKDDIRRERLPLYLAEYVCRYNHRSVMIKDQIKDYDVIDIVKIL